MGLGMFQKVRVEVYVKGSGMRYLFGQGRVIYQGIRLYLRVMKRVLEMFQKVRIELYVEECYKWYLFGVSRRIYKGIRIYLRVMKRVLGMSQKEHTFLNAVK